MSGAPQEATGAGPSGATIAGRPVCAETAHELEHLQKDWKWFFVLGTALIAFGVIALGTSFFVSVFTVAMFGALLLLAGLAQIVSSFWAGKWSGLLLHVLIGILYVVTGYFMLDAPLQGALALTLLIAAFLIVGGIFRIVAAMMLQFHDWGWGLLNGVVSLMLGILIYKQWPASGLWVIGLFVGIELIFNGLAWVMLSLGLRAIAPPDKAAAA